MEIYRLDSDIELFCVTAHSFPEGIQEAFRDLHSRIGELSGRRIYGISFMEKGGKTIYKAAATAMSPGEGNRFNCEPFILRKGDYVFVDIKNFMENIPAIGKAFAEMLAMPGIDPQGVCVEEYNGDQSVKCMVKLAS